MYWDIRRLSVQVCVMRKDDSGTLDDIGRQQNMPCVLQGSNNAPGDLIITQPPPEIDSSLAEPLILNFNEMPWVDDDVEYVGLDDEDPVADSDSDCEEHGDVECLEDDLVPGAPCHGEPPPVEGGWEGRRTHLRTEAGRGGALAGGGRLGRVASSSTEGDREGGSPLAGGGRHVGTVPSPVER
jgi:hypothetical protein